jgi:hypothetical protein
MISEGSRRLNHFVFLLGVLLFTCSAALAQDVSNSYAQGTNFSKLKTHEWVNIPGSDTPIQIVEQQIKQSIDSQLAAKGSIKTDAEKADLYVAYQVCMAQERQWHTYGMGGMGWRIGKGIATASSSIIQAGSLGFDAYDQAAKQYTWTETQETIFEGESKSSKLFQCEYGPDGKVQKTVLSSSLAPQQQSSYSAQTVLDATAKQVQIRTISSGYTKS